MYAFAPPRRCFRVRAVAPRRNGVAPLSQVELSSAELSRSLCTGFEAAEAAPSTTEKLMRLANEAIIPRHRRAPRCPQTPGASAQGLWPPGPRPPPRFSSHSNTAPRGQQLGSGLPAVGLVGPRRLIPDASKLQKQDAQE